MATKIAKQKKRAIRIWFIIATTLIIVPIAYLIPSFTIIDILTMWILILWLWYGLLYKINRD